MAIFRRIEVSVNLQNPPAFSVGISRWRQSGACRKESKKLGSILIRQNAETSKDHWRNVVGLSRVIGPGSFSAVVYQSLVNEDNDGAPNCYGPIGMSPRPLDELRNATNNENHVFSETNHNFLWRSVYNVKKEDVPANPPYEPDFDPKLEDHDGNFPVKQKSGATKGFYVSTTSRVVNSGAERWDPARYLNAAAVPYGAITPPLLNLQVSPGDLGFAICADRRLGKGFFFGDAGVKNKVGEISRNLFRTFFPRADQEDHPVTFIVFPGVATNSINGNDLDSAVRVQMGRLSQMSNPDHLARFLSFPPQSAFLNLGSQAAPEIREPAKSNGKVSEMQRLRNALKPPSVPDAYTNNYLNLIAVMRQFGLTLP
jgi:hypothetical protein